MSCTIPLTPAEYHAILRDDLSLFIERSFRELNPQTNFIPGQYIELLAATLDKCRTGETKRLIINMPPRTLKSHAASVAFPAWLLGHDPTIQIICASYGQDLADKHARDTRTLMQSPFYRQLFPGTVLSDKRSVNDFVTTRGGFRMATSVGGVLTGRGADVIILDDILKPDDALSETRRRAANDWYFNTLLSRLNSKEHGVIITLMQRLHEADLVGEVLDREPRVWKVLSLPAIAIQDESYQYKNLFGESTFCRKANTALHPERDSLETYQQIRAAVGEYNFNSQYQQSPTSRDGGMVKREWLKFYDSRPRGYSTVAQSWDTACKSGDANDWSVCTTWMVCDGNYYLIHVSRERLNYPDLKRKAVELFTLHQPDKVYIEDRASGMALIQELKGEGVYCVQSYTPAPGSDKRVRFAAQAMKFESGKVLLPREANWLEAYIAEITGFPGSKYDDQVDSTSQALEMLDSCARYSEPSFGPVRSIFPPYVRETC